MQALSIWPSKGDFCSASQSHFVQKSFDISNKRRHQRGWDRCGTPRLWVVSSDSSAFGSGACWDCEKLDSRCGFFSGYQKCKTFLVCESSKGSFGASVALEWALEQQAAGHESVKENLVDGMDETNAKDLVNKIIDTKRTNNEEQKEVDLEESSATDEKSRRVNVRALALSLASAKTAEDVREVLKDKGELPLQVYSTMIKCFGRDKKLGPAMALVEWLKRRKKETDGLVGPNLFVYNSLLGAVKQSEQYAQVERVMNDMAVEGVAPNIVTYNTLMLIHVEQGRATEALNLFNDIQRMGFSLTPASYSTALLAYQRAEDGFGALDLFTEVREKYLKGDLGKDAHLDWETEFAKLTDFTMRVCYLVMRRCLVKYDGASIKVLKLLTDMDNAGIQFGHEEYERLVWACTKEEHYTVAKDLYRRIREKHSEISISVCNHIIWLMGKARKWWDALEIYEDLLGKGPKPNNLSHELIVSHFNVLLTAARKRGIWRWGVRLLNKMEDKGIRPSTREWNAVLVACSKASETTAAVQIFKRMIEKDAKPTIVSYGALLSALEKGKLYDESFRVWEHMIKVGVEPNVHAYTVMASVCVGQGKFNLVDSIIREMVASKNEPTVVTYNAIISGCARKGMGSMAFEWFHRMKVQNIDPNEVTYEMLIEALSKDGKPRLAYEIYLRAQKQGLSLSSKAYDAVIQSSQSYDASIDFAVLGPRPPDKKKKVQIRKSFSEFCDLADVSRRSKPFDRMEIFGPNADSNTI